MDKNQKYEFVKKVEEYLEEKRVVDLFQSLTKQLLIHRPDSPLDFLIERIGKKEPIRVFIVGPPGSMAKSLSRRLSKELGFTSISLGDIMRRESMKSSDIGAKILEGLKNYRYIPDDIVIYIIKNYILKWENEYQNWILEGFPRTKAQALTLQKIGIIPDKFILLNANEETSIERVRKALIEDGTKLVGVDLDHAAENAIAEYNLHIKGVKDWYSKFIYEADVEKSLEEMEQDLIKMVKIKISDQMRPPRIIILGPPGSGRSTQAKHVAKKYGIVHISIVDLLKEEMNRRTARGKIIAEWIGKGEMVASTIVIAIVEKRLKESDWYVNGWVMDGFPKTVEQVSLLTQMKIIPTKVVILEWRQEVCIERLSLKRIDPVSGLYYNLADQVPEDQDVYDRLIEIEGNDTETVKKRWFQWDEFVGKIEEIFSNWLLNIKTDSKSTLEISHIITDSIQS